MNEAHAISIKMPLSTNIKISVLFCIADFIGLSVLRAMSHVLFAISHCWTANTVV